MAGNFEVTNPDEGSAAQGRRKRKLQLQRERRARNQRIDYYVSEAALAIINARTTNSVGGDHSSVINRLVLAGAKRRASGINGHIARARARVMGSGSEGSDAEARYRFPEDDPSFVVRTRRASSKAERSRKPPPGLAECGARTRKGTPCKCQPERGRRRCRQHGGMSTGPRSVDGKARARANLRQFRLG